ncbi:MarR family transcriptional regulator [Thalassobius sp. I31.1]|uniref:MarR family winged helix-turn-helix transcriptional regulator n=1 Tax=Thalassobius sp. I31.1 TaxID=2109912 RepID=UPI000D1AF3F0|nr:MarR family transcriptional regulator [Thalassobius sp. I31.1]
MTDGSDPLAIALFSEVFMTGQLARNRLSKALPKGMELSHFSVLNHLAHVRDEKSPVQLARAFHVTKGAMTNTLSKLEWAGYIHIRPDWDDARRKFVSISPAGKSARDAALHALTPVIGDAVHDIGPDKIRAALPVLRTLREELDED